jgi:hypothetical protein
MMQVMPVSGNAMGEGGEKAFCVYSGGSLKLKFGRPLAHIHRSETIFFPKSILAAQRYAPVGESTSTTVTWRLPEVEKGRKIMTAMITVKPLETDVHRFDEETAGTSLAVGLRRSEQPRRTAEILVTIVDEPAVPVVVHRHRHRHRETVAGRGATSG